MAPNSDSTFIQPLPEPTINKPAKPSLEPLQRTISDISFELIARVTLNENDNENNDLERDMSPPLPPIPEIEDAKCECCGMCEECTPQYVKKVRDKYRGRMICGLCSEAVSEGMVKNGGNGEEALHAHVSACSRFNRVGRAYPVLCQAQAMKEVLRNSRAKSLSPRDKKGTNAKRGRIERSTSCIPAITKDMSGRKTT